MVCTYKHQAAPYTAYATNVSNTTVTNDCYEYSDSTNTTATGETPHNTAFDIVIRVGAAKNDCCYTANSTWNENYMWLNGSCASIGLTADTNFTERFVAQDGKYYCYVQYYVTNTTGFVISEGESFNLSAVRLYVQRLS
jgi:hypothetical protein